MLRLTLIQSDLIWESPAENLARFDKHLANVPPGSTDLVVLPEMFTTGFSMNAKKLAEPASGGPTMQWMQETANRLDAAVTGSIIVGEKDGRFYNRLLWIEPHAAPKHYDKRHLFSLGGEQNAYTRGENMLIVEWRNWRIYPLICYDLRFPVWCRNLNDYDLLIFVANWPQRRIGHWNTLLQARAIENQCYTVGVNRIGTDGADLYYNGDSCLIDPNGEIMWKVSSTEAAQTLLILKRHLHDIRKRLPFLADRD